jgi:site-specific DNA recombinase
LVLYGRVSVDRREGKRVDEQLAWLRAWAAREGHEVVAEHRDDGISASQYARHRTRPGWQEAMADIATGRGNAIAVWEASRASRERRVWAALLAALEEAGGYFVEAGRVHDPADPDDGFLLDLQAAQSRRESAMTRKRVIDGVRARAAAGEPHGQAVYGYRIEYDPETGKAVRRVHDAKQAPVVREIARRLLAGESATGVAKDLTERGVRTARGNRWYASNLIQLIQRPALAGLRTFHGEVLEDVRTTWEPILTVEQHRQLVAKFSDPARKVTRDGSHRKSLLVGPGRCGVCGAGLRLVTKIHASGSRTLVYSCRERYCVSRNSEPVDKLVELVMVKVLQRPELTARLAAGDPEASAASDEAARLQAKLDEARRLVDADRLSLESLADLEARTLPRLRAAREAARPRHVPTVVTDTAGPDAAQRWAALDVHQKRAIIGALADVRVMKAPRRPPGDHPAILTVHSEPLGSLNQPLG